MARSEAAGSTEVRLFDLYSPLDTQYQQVVESLEMEELRTGKSLRHLVPPIPSVAEIGELKASEVVVLHCPMLFDDMFSMRFTVGKVRTHNHIQSRTFNYASVVAAWVVIDLAHGHGKSPREVRRSEHREKLMALEVASLIDLGGSRIHDWIRDGVIPALCVAGLICERSLDFQNKYVVKFGRDAAEMVSENIISNTQSSPSVRIIK